MRGVDLTTLRLRVRWRTDSAGDTRRFPDSELDDCINEGIAAFHGELVRAGGMGIEEAETSFLTVPSTETYLLPASFLQIRGIVSVYGGQQRTLRVYDETDLDLLNNSDLYMQPAAMYYRLVGDNITIKPTPKEAATIRIKYVKTAVKLLAPSSVLDGVDGLEEFVICWAGECFCVKNNEQDRLSALVQRRGEVLDRIIALTSNREDAEPAHFEDAALRQQTRRGYGPYGRNR